MYKCTDSILSDDTGFDEHWQLFEAEAHAKSDAQSDERWSCTVELQLMQSRNAVDARDTLQVSAMSVAFTHIHKLDTSSDHNLSPSAKTSTDTMQQHGVKISKEMAHLIGCRW